MGKKRIIDMDGLCFDAELTELGMDACMLYIRLWTLAEDWGGVDLEPKNLRLQMGGLQDNYDNLRITEITQKLVELDKIKIYEYKSRIYGWIKNFPRYQELRFPSPPKLPLPPWVKWYPKEGQNSPIQRYEYLSIDTSTVPSIDISIEQSTVQSTDQSTDCANVNEEKRSRREIEIKDLKDNPSHKVTSMPSSTYAVSANGISEKQILSQLGVGVNGLGQKRASVGREKIESPEQESKQILERRRIETERRGIK